MRKILALTLITATIFSLDAMANSSVPGRILRPVDQPLLPEWRKNECANLSIDIENLFIFLDRDGPTAPLCEAHAIEYNRLVERFNMLCFWSPDVNRWKPVNVYAYCQVYI